MGNLTIEPEPGGADTLVVHLGGAMDAHTAPDLEKKLEELLQGGYRWAVLDFGAVDYVSSAGFGVILGAIHSWRVEGGDIKAAAIAEPILRLLTMLGFQRVLEVHPSVASALASLGASATGGRRPESEG